MQENFITRNIELSTDLLHNDHRFLKDQCEVSVERLGRVLSSNAFRGMTLGSCHLCAC